MLKKTSQGYQVVSETGKSLSRPNLTKEQAEKRLAQIEMFKHMKKTKKQGSSVLSFIFCINLEKTIDIF